MIGIYGIHNLVNGKWYVGQAVDIEKRNKSERYFLERGSFHGPKRDNAHISAAWKKYGPHAFEWVVLEECDAADLDHREMFWISEKDSYRNGYNQTLGGGGRRGYHLGQETKSKISAALKGVPLRSETRAKMSAAHMGHAVSQKCRDKTRERSSRAVLETRPSGETVQWASATAAARSLGLYQTNITKCCRGKLARTGGSRWRYAD